MRNLIVSAVFGILAAVIITVVFLHFGKPKKVAESPCALIHMPKQGCPPGWRKREKFFTEKDGSTVGACLAPKSQNREPCFDELRPGESMGITIEITNTTDNYR